MAVKLKQEQLHSGGRANASRGTSVRHLLEIRSIVNDCKRDSLVESN